MLQDPKEIIKIWTDELTKASTEIVSATLKGEQVERLPIQVMIMIPQPLVTAIIRASQVTGSDPDEVISQMANHGFQKSIDEKLMMGRQLVTPPTTGTGIQGAVQSTNDIFGQLKGLGMDMSGLEGKMGQFGELMTMLSTMKEQMENVATDIRTGDVPKGQSSKDPE